LARSFLPPNIENKAWLPYYSQIFNYVEIDSTFYNIPSKQMVTNWNRRTPDNFRFTAKFPKIITHDKIQECTKGFRIILPKNGTAQNKVISATNPVTSFLQTYFIFDYYIIIFQTGNIIRTWLN
jgi:uncharacterized protein YecE (DUF72 family)